MPPWAVIGRRSHSGRWELGTPRHVAVKGGVLPPSAVLERTCTEEVCLQRRALLENPQRGVWGTACDRAHSQADVLAGVVQSTC